MGLVYHLWFFSVINKAALIFAAFFVLQGILFFIAGVLKSNLRFRFRRDFLGIAGMTRLLIADCGVRIEFQIQYLASRI